jgi:outer membrane protein OmpA-like peptidoglycan-associated protein
MARIREEDCRWCTPALVVAVVLVGWFGFVHGPARPDQLRLRAEQSVERDLTMAGFPWAKLQSRGDTAVLVGEAPSDEARQAAAAAADVLLARFMGWPGVYAQIDKKLQVAAVGDADRQALAAARRAVARADQPLDLPATSAGPAAATATSSAAAMAGVKQRADAASAATTATGTAAATSTSARQVAVLAPAAPPAAAATVRPDPACQRELAQVQQGAPVRFKAGAATLDIGQDDKVDALAGLLKRCIAGRVLVHGLREAPGAAVTAPSTDGASAEGADKEVPMGSLLLAQRRAQALRAELVAHGVAPARLQLGAGAREVLGDTPARVELTLAPADRP